jgi:phosphoenolpyruvate carboxykinase (GTP)
MNSLEFLRVTLDTKNFEKLKNLDNTAIFDFVAEYIRLASPKSVFVRTDSPEDIEYLRNKALELGEEKPLHTKGQTVHFDGPFDQGRDKEVTRYLVSAGSTISYYVNSIERGKGTKEIREIFAGIMKAKEMFVCFFCLGPLDSAFSLLAVQITDSAYVAHSEDILYRPGYEQFKKNPQGSDFFKFVHSAGELQNHVSKDVDKKRIYIDLEGQLVYSANTQYAGNTVGLKKLALRLAIQKASREHWLAEHMFLMSVADESGEREYFAGAYPSMCGKTSTAMIGGETIVGDDIAYLRNVAGTACAVNVERGIFGIIKDVNPHDDGLLFNCLNREGEVIFSNILVDERRVPFWIGKSKDMPHKGVNFSGEWFPGKADAKGEEVPPSHKNARYTIRLRDLENVDKNLECPEGVVVKGLIYGGRDSDTWVPVEEAFSWEHGIVTKAAALESETTAATLGQEGVRVFNPMSNMDFLSVSLGAYLEMNLSFGKKLDNAPRIFSVNYFLRNKEGKFLNGMQDKRVWLKWMRRRTQNKSGGLMSPTGVIPCYEDLRALFKEVLSRDYSQREYIEQFTVRIPENLAKIERITNIYKKLKSIPEVLFAELNAQVERLRTCQKSYGDAVSPLSLKKTS